jgi:hypothetical protein
MIYRGEPSDNAVTASRSVTLYDSDNLYQSSDSSQNPLGPTISGSNFYAPDAASGGIYNVVEVEVVVWRM